MIFKIIKKILPICTCIIIFIMSFSHFSLKKKCTWEGNGDSVLQDYIMYLFFKEKVLGNSMF